jgi:hypothetical protein
MQKIIVCTDKPDIVFDGEEVASVTDDKCETAYVLYRVVNTKLFVGVKYLYHNSTEIISAEYLSLHAITDQRCTRYIVKGIASFFGHSSMAKKLYKAAGIYNEVSVVAQPILPA